MYLSHHRSFTLYFHKNKKAFKSLIFSTVTDFFSGSCSFHLVGDGICHGENNNELCQFDGGDCCSGQDGVCLYCFQPDCTCHETETDFCPGI